MIPLFLGGVSFALGTPIVHIADGNLLFGAASFVGRVTLVLGGAAVGLASDSSPAREGGLLAGAAIGAGVMMIVDAVFLAHESAPAPKSKPASVMPTAGLAGPRMNAPFMGLSGAF